MADEGRPISQVLHQAIASGDLDTVQALLQKGVNANSTLVARCPLDARYSLSMDTQNNNKNKNNPDLTRYSLGVDRYIGAKPFSKDSKGYSSKERVSENNNFLEYNCRDSMRETPIVESDFEDEDVKKTNLTEDEEMKVKKNGRKPFNKDDVVTKLNEMNDILNKLNEHSNQKASIIEEMGRNEQVVKPNKYIENDQSLRELLEKCTEDDHHLDEKPALPKIPMEKSEMIEQPRQTVYVEEVTRPVTPLFPVTTNNNNIINNNNNNDNNNMNKSNKTTNNAKRRSRASMTTADKRQSKTNPEKRESKISDTAHEKRESVMTTEGEEDILVERPSSLVLDPRAHSEELLIEEKPLKLIPKLKKKLSNRWRTKDHVVREKRTAEKKSTDQLRSISRNTYESSRSVVGTEKQPRNADNEQLAENYDGLAFFEAVRHGMDMTVQTLLETSNNNQLNMADENGFSPLMQAAWHGQQECLRVLLQHGANVSLRNNAGCTATHFAAAQGHVACLEVLIEHAHVDVNSHTKFNATPLILAAKGGHCACVSLLLEHGADVNMQYRGNQNALLFAAGNGHYETMQILMSNGVQVDQANSQGVTPLMRAIQQGHNACAELLLSRDNEEVDDEGVGEDGGSRGVEVNVQDVMGRTPVHLAIEHDNPEGLKLLIRHGAVLDVLTHGGSTPSDYLDRFPSAQCAAILNEQLELLQDQAKEGEEEKEEGDGERGATNTKTKKKKKAGKQPSCVCFRRGKGRRDNDDSDEE